MAPPRHLDGARSTLPLKPRAGQARDGVDDARGTRPPRLDLEEKVDGWRNAKRFREIATAISALPVPTLVLDGEVAIFDQQLRSRFDLLRHSDPDIVATPPVFIAFDLLYWDGIDVSGRPLQERRAQLEEHVTGGDLVFPVRRLPPHGLEAWATVLASGYEGMVGKDEASPYRGGVTRSWLKVKVPGWTDPEDKWRRIRLDTKK